MDRLYNRLPAVYRIRDTEQGEPLRALLGVIEEELLRLEGDIDGLYADLFIETCAEWVVPYLGELVAATPLSPLENAGVSLRAFVANTLAYRRRKGTASVLEPVTTDSTGWPSRVVEYFELLSATQHLNHLRSHSLRTPSFRRSVDLELIDGPFDMTTHTPDVRSAARRLARPNIPNIGVWVWRSQAYQVERSEARVVADPADGRFTFDPLGFSVPLVANPEPQRDMARLAGEDNVPELLRRRPLYDELEARRQAQVDNASHQAVYFGSVRPAFRIFEGAAEVPPERILIARLPDEAVPTGWRRPPATLSYTPAAGGAAQVLPIRVAVDPVLGRLAFPAGVAPAGAVRVSYQYGAPGDCGGGPYDRTDSANAAIAGGVTWQAAVGEGLISYNGEPVFTTLAAAVNAWNALPPGHLGLISVTDSRSYVEDLTGLDSIRVSRGSLLVVMAAKWPDVANPAVAGGRRRIPGRIAASELRPCLRGAVNVEGLNAGAGEPGQLVWNGILIDGAMTVAAGRLGRLELAHTTVRNGLTAGACGDLAVDLRSAVLGRLILHSDVPRFSAERSILLASAGGVSISAPGAEARIDATTVFGGATVEQLSASDAIFASAVAAERVQSGCVRFSYVAPGSRTARRHKCQPDLAVAARARELGVEALPPAELARVRLEAAPLFAARELGHPSLARLSAGCPDGIARGAEDGSEMGAWWHLAEPQRRANFRAAVSGFVPFGMRADVMERS